MLNKSYYKTRIIFTFGVVTIILVVAISITSYNFIRNLYLDEISSHVKTSTQIISNQIDESYLDILSIGPPTKLTQAYFQNIFKNNTVNKTPSEIFIFNKNFMVLVHSDFSFVENRSNPNLIIYKKDIEALTVKQSFTSIPFKGDDGNWYLWGFYRFDRNYFLAVKESADKLQKVEDFATLFLYFGLIATVITIIVSWLIAKSITKPVDRLIKFSNEIGKGNFNVRPPENMKGEIALLSTAMEKMKNNLFENQKERENMLAQIAHEIRNPLGGIELFANLVKEDLKNENKNTENLDKILKEINGLKTLITAYLNYSKPKIATQELINLPDLMNDINNVFKPDLDKKKVRINYDLQSTNVWFDPEHLRQILINVVSNSLHSVSEDGLITITSNANHTNWWISVFDNGQGISEENIGLIFEPFFTTKKDGTGLGLSICKKLAKENNATIEAVNNKGRGCTFTIFGVDNKK
ncbi:MAG: ATP-binding protein [Bacteroidota bacterium]|nr:ATP-binding protein [Bacteroidota bacterium]